MTFIVVLHSEGYGNSVVEEDWHALGEGEEYYSAPFAYADPVFTEVFVTAVEAESKSEALVLAKAMHAAKGQG